MVWTRGRPTCTLRRNSHVHDARRARRFQRIDVDGQHYDSGCDSARRSCRDGRPRVLGVVRQDVDGTTEVAAFVVLAAGLLAGIGSVAVIPLKIATPMPFAMAPSDRTPADEPR